MRKIEVTKGMSIRGVAIAMLDNLREGRQVEAEFNGVKLQADDKSTVDRIISSYKAAVLARKGKYRKNEDNLNQ